jgi:hypothetical protein
MAKKVSNDRLADHPDAPGKYLKQVRTSVDGSYQMISLDPKNRQTIQGFLTDDGSFHVQMTKGNGEVNHSAAHGIKQFFDSMTATFSGHSDVNAGGGEVQRNAQGGHREHGADSTKAAQGTQQNAAADSKNDITKGGNGKHHMNGDQTFVVDDGGITYKANDFGITAAKTTTITSKKVIKISSEDAIQFQVGNNVLLISKQGISISTDNCKGIQLITSSSGNILIDSEKGNVGVIAEAGPVNIRAAEKLTIKTKQGTFTEVANSAPAGPPATTYTPGKPWSGSLND